MDYKAVMSTKNEFDGEEIANPMNSMVDHPRHYNREGAMECIDEMELIFGPEVVMHFCLGCVFKYRYRAGLKDNGYQDLEKSDWYMNKYRELKEKVGKKNNCSITIPKSYEIGGNSITLPKGGCISRDPLF